MLLRIGFEIGFQIPAPIAMVGTFHVHPSRIADLRAPDDIHISPQTPHTVYLDGFGNRCSRVRAPAGDIRIGCSTVIEDSGQPDPVVPHARAYPVWDLPDETLSYLLNSRYCEVDRLSQIAVDLFGNSAPGWPTVAAICDWIHSKVSFGYPFARPTKTALDVFTERAGVCRDFQHLAITFCRALNIPARYATGYLGDIGIPAAPTPMDLSAWFQVFLEGQWWNFDARHNQPRIGRILMAVGRDASDVAITTAFGVANLNHFSVVTEEEPAGK